MSERPPAQARRTRFRLLRWIRKARVAWMLGFAGLVFWFMVSAWPRQIPGLNPLFEKLERAENATYDLRFRWRGAEPAHPNVAVLAINKPLVHRSEVRETDLASSDALRAMGEKEFPWRRKVWAEVLDKLFAAGARVVAFDVVFASENQDDPAFLAALEKYRGRVALAMTVQEVSTGRDTSALQVIYPNPALLNVTGPRSVGCAVVHPDTQDDRIVRRIDHFTSELRELGYEDDRNEIPSLSALAVELYTGDPAIAEQRKLVRYQGPRQTYPYLSVQSLFEENVYRSPAFRNGDVFRDRIVFIGATYELSHDDKQTPFGMMYGVEVHAQAAADLLNGKPIAEVSPPAAWWITLAATMSAVAAIGFFRRAWVQAVGLLSLLLAYVLATHVAFSSFDRVLPMLAPLIGLTATGAFGVLISFAIEQWEKAHTRKVLNRFVHPRVAAVVLKNAEDFEHGRAGERRRVAVLFTDIRAFTTWTETAEPEHLVGQMNEYFGRMVPLIDMTDGVVQKFIGDAILACWGDIVSKEPEDDVRRAVRTALAMRPALRELNDQWAGRDDRRVISIGMGLNYGDAVVGESGHPNRREWTVLGDAVNFAARLESATKQFHTDCLVGESVEQLTRDHFRYRHVDYLRVKGKTKPVNVYSVISDRSVPAPEWLEDYHRARELYRTRQFAEAAALFRDVKARIGGEDFLCDMYAERCDLYADLPPPDDWDGSYTLTDK